MCGLKIEQLLFAFLYPGNFIFRQSRRREGLLFLLLIFGVRLESELAANRPSSYFSVWAASFSPPLSSCLFLGDEMCRFGKGALAENFIPL